MVHLGVELHAVKAALLIADAHGGAGGGAGNQGEALGHLGHVVAMAHPGDALLGQPLEEAAAGVEEGLRLAIFPGRVGLGGGHLPAQLVGQQLAAVADAQNGYAQTEHAGVHMGGFFIIDTVGAAGEDDAHGIIGSDLLKAHIKGLDFAVYITFADAAGDQLVILSAEVQYKNFLVSHQSAPPQNMVIQASRSAPTDTYLLGQLMAFSM